MPVSCLLSAIITVLTGTGSQPAATGTEPGVTPVVEVEEVVTTYAPPNNGAGPLWCYGAPLLVRRGGQVYVSVAETGKDVPPLSNTRCRLWRRDASGWQVIAQEEDYREREPCPLAALGDVLFLSLNPSSGPPGTRYGPCRPEVLAVSTTQPAQTPLRGEPSWAAGSHFTDHSYRGFAADDARGELLLLHIDAPTGRYFVSHRTRTGAWRARDTIAFPIRACYPQVALRDGAAHVLAIGDIVEPVEAWRRLKREVLKQDWDYVFRRLFYTWTPDVALEPFAPPIEIDTVEETGGHIANMDLYTDPAGTTHMLYVKRPFAHAFLRDRYFAGRPMSVALEYRALHAGKVTIARTLLESPDGREGLAVAHARFHVDADNRLYIVVAASGEVNGQRRPMANHVARMGEGSAGSELIPLRLEKPLTTFFTNSLRGGSAPSDTLDLFGIGDDQPNLRYARIRLRG